MKQLAAMLIGVAPLLSAAIPALAEPVAPPPPPEPPSRPPQARPASVPPPIPGTVIYRSSFDKGKTDGWSGRKPLPLDKDKGIVAPLHNQTARLELAKIPAHKFLHLRLDLYVMETWDGGTDGAGNDADMPDTITIKVAGGPTLLHASFAVVPGCTQSYPDNGLWARHPARTGAVRNLEGRQAGGSLYSLAFTFRHTDRKAVLEFTGSLSETDPQNRNVENEHWGIGNVVVSALAAAPVRLDDRRFAQLWADLAHTDPIKANRAVWTLISAGRDAVPHVEKGLGLPQDRSLAKKTADLVRQLDDDDWRVRQRATQELKALGQRAHPYLRRTLATKAPLEVKVRIEEVLSAHKDSAPEQLRAGRLRWALKVIGGDKADALVKTLPIPQPPPPVRRPQRDVIFLERQKAVQIRTTY